MTVTDTLARFASELQITDVPLAITSKMKLHVLDAIGCGWAASFTSLGEQARQVARAMGGQGSSTVFGGGGDYSLTGAAFANAFIINALDHDDGVDINGKGLGHPGSTLVAAAMAALDATPGKVKEEDLLAALVAGFEVNHRLIHALQPSPESFAKAYGVGQHQAIGAAVVYARANGFDEQMMHNAMGFAATLTCVPSLHKYNWQDRPIASLKDGVAPAAQAGVQAALMAQAGLAGSRDVFDGPVGYWRMVGSDRFDPEALVEGLGREWFLRFGSFKRYPACRWLATALECAEVLIAEYHWHPQDISHVEVGTFSCIAEDFMVYRPTTATDAQFSLPYTVAATILGVPATAWYDENTMKSAKLLSLAEKVTATVEPQLDELWLSLERQPGATVTITNCDGAKIRHSLARPNGSATRPIPAVEIIDKARLNLKYSLRDPDSFIADLLEGEHEGRRLGGAKEWIGLTN